MTPPPASAPPAHVPSTPRRGQQSRRCCARASRELVTYAGWEAIDRHERALGEPAGRPRVKLTRIERAPAGRRRRTAVDCSPVRAPLAHLAERRTFNPVGRVRVSHGAFLKSLQNSVVSTSPLGSASNRSRIGPETCKGFGQRERFTGEGDLAFAGAAGGHLDSKDVGASTRQHSAGRSCASRRPLSTKSQILDGVIRRVYLKPPDAAVSVGAASGFSGGVGHANHRFEITMSVRVRPLPER